MGVRCKARNYCRKYYFASNKGQGGNHLEEKSTDRQRPVKVIHCMHFKRGPLVEISSKVRRKSVPKKSILHFERNLQI